MKTLFTALLALLTPLVASAQDERGFYFGGSIGQSTFKESCVPTSTINCDEKGTALRFFAGYQINRQFAVEAGYADLGEAKATQRFGGGSAGTLQASALDLAALLSLSVVDHFALYTRLGVAYGETSASTTFSSPPTFGNDTRFDITFGFGARYDFTRRLAARIDWQRYPYMSQNDIEVLAFGLLYRM